MRPAASTILMSTAASGVDCCIDTEPSIAPAWGGCASANACCMTISSVAVQRRAAEDTVAASYCSHRVPGTWFLVPCRASVPGLLSELIRPDCGPGTKDHGRTKD